MPLVEVYGFQRLAGAGVEKYEFNKSLREAVASQKEMGITSKNITVVHPCDTEEADMGVIVIIRGLFVRKERTHDLQINTCHEVVDEVRKHLRPFNLSFVEVWVEPFDITKHGFAEWKP
jgi:hypothetical protein